MFSVIIAAYNSEKYLNETISSLLNQTFKDWECIISINGSSDKTLQISQNICNIDTRFSLIESREANKSCALNRAIILSKNEWISILDSDDIWQENKLEEQKKVIVSNPAIDIVGTQLEYIDELGQHMKNAPVLPETNEECHLWLYQKRNPIANSSVVYKKSIHDIVGFYDSEKFGVEDYDMWMRCKRKKLRFQNLNDKFLYHRIHKISNFNSSNKQEKYKNLVDSIESYMSCL